MLVFYENIFLFRFYNAIEKVLQFCPWLRSLKKNPVVHSLIAKRDYFIMGKILKLVLEKSFVAGQVKPVALT